MAARTTRHTKLTDQFERAMSWAIELHGSTPRKGTDIPYVSHLLGVASLVLEDGGTEDDAIAGLLHDAIEDCDVTEPDFEKVLGPERGARVFAVVAACSDGIGNPEAPRDESTWRERKARYLVHLVDPGVTDEVLRVSVADKLHNARAILADVRAHGPGVWDKFNAGVTDQLWYYRSLTDIFLRRYPRPITHELANVVGEIAQIANRQDTGPEPVDTPPLHFDCFIGGFMGTSYRVHLDGDELVHETLDHYDPSNVTRCTPKTADWEQFWMTLDAVDAWSWAGDYRHPEIVDGTNWSIRILHGARLLAAEGSNGYPPIGNDSEPGSTFRQLLAAVSRLVGKPFE